MAILIYSDEIGLRNSTQLGVVWIPAFAGMTTTRFFANHFVRSIAIVAAKITARRNSFSECLLSPQIFWVGLLTSRKKTSHRFLSLFPL